ncbi:MAG: DNA gyrase C-terminal beta-propeller domain-containing protein, partial [Polaribacter sp.]|nr:DNA gyrase C-terminal beta-propeller domain-containing protein [Polaribacter sp.]
PKPTSKDIITINPPIKPSVAMSRNYIVKVSTRMAVADMRVMGRATQGVRLINIKDSDSIAAVAKVQHEEEEEIEENETGTEVDNTSTESQE